MQGSDEIKESLRLRSLELESRMLPIAVGLMENMKRRSEALAVQNVIRFCQRFNGHLDILVFSCLSRMKAGSKKSDYSRRALGGMKN